MEALIMGIKSRSAVLAVTLCMVVTHFMVFGIEDGFGVMRVDAAEGSILEVPVWSVGDYWNYSGTYVGDSYKLFEDQVMESFVNSTVSLVVVVEESVGCYLTSIEGTFAGMFTYKFGQQQFTGDFEYELSGTSKFAITDLSVLEEDIQLDITCNIPNFPLAHITNHTQYSPALDFMDFPVQEGEQWTTNTQASTIRIVNTFHEQFTTSVNCDNRCIRVSGSGDNEIFDIQTDYVPFLGEVVPTDNAIIKWSEAKGMIEQITACSADNCLNLQLIDYQYYKGIVVENVPPSASFVYTPSKPSKQEIVNFTDQSTDADGHITSWLWDFGDGEVSYSNNPKHIFQNTGTYNIVLTVTDDDGATDQYSQTIKINHEEDETPGFEYSLVLVAAGLAMLILQRKRRY